MRKNLLQIHFLSSYEPDDENIVQIKLENEDIVQFNFWKLFYLSKYIQDKYKYSEALNSIQSEIENIITTMQIKEETIKLFIQLIQYDKVSIPIDQYKNFYKVSSYFKITRFTRELERIGQEELYKDIEFAIQTLADLDSSNDEYKDDLQSKIETFLANRINECIECPKFNELQISMIHRILLKSTKENINYDSLVDFIFNSVEERFTLLKFVEFHRLTDEKIEHLINCFDELDDQKSKMYMEFLPFDLLFIKQIKHKYDNVLQNYEQTKQELNQTKQNYEQTKEELNQTNQNYKQTKQSFEQTKEELNQTNQNYEQTKEELNQTKQNYEQTKEELNQINQNYKQTKQELNQTKQSFEQTKQELNQTKQNYEQTKQELNQTTIKLKQTKDDPNLIRSETKRYARSIFVAGSNSNNRLCEDSTLVIKPPKKSPIDPSSLLSYSVFQYHSVLVTRNGSLLAAGNNSDGRISSSLPKTTINNFTEFSLEGIGSQFVPVSAVCCFYSTVYMFSKVDSGRRQLVFCDRDIKGGSPIFLNIGNQEPVALFGLNNNAAAINSEGEIIFIDRYSVKNSPNSHISSFSLPDGEKASSVAYCGDKIVALSRSGRVFTKSGGVLNFSKVDELASEEIVSISGVIDYCLAVSKTGRVFGLGSNSCGQLGLSNETGIFSSFTELSSLSKYEITAAYAGYWHSFFVTREGKILSCGQNGSGQLFLNNSEGGNVFSPTETTITDSTTFFILGNCLTVAFIGGEPPPNTPNMKI